MKKLLTVLALTGFIAASAVPMTGYADPGGPATGKANGESLGGAGKQGFRK